MRVKHLSTLLSLKLPARCLVQSPLSPGRESSRLVISPHRGCPGKRHKSWELGRFSWNFIQFRTEPSNREAAEGAVSQISWHCTWEGVWLRRKDYISLPLNRMPRGVIPFSSQGLLTIAKSYEWKPWKFSSLSSAQSFYLHWRVWLQKQVSATVVQLYNRKSL